MHSLSSHQAPPLSASQPGSRPVRTSRRITRAQVAATRAAQPAASVQQPDWDYKYPHLPCSSPCQPGDRRCLQVEALFQNVLNYPRLPIRMCQSLARLETDISGITTTVEALNNRYGSELVLFWLRKQPRIVEHDIDTLVRLHSAGFSSLASILLLPLTLWCTIPFAAGWAS
jgi:hypothetical protein